MIQYRKGGFRMSVLPYVLLLEVSEDDEVLVYSANTDKEYTFIVKPEYADIYRAMLEDDEESLLEFDEETEQIRSI